MGTISQSGSGFDAAEPLAVKLLIQRQRLNIRVLMAASAIMFLVGIALFVVLWQHHEIQEIGPALGNLLTFLSGLFPITGVIAANSRIGELEAAMVLISSHTALSSHEEDLLKELLKR